MKKIFIVLVFIGFGVGIYFYIKSKSITTKAQAITVIAAYSGLGEAVYQSFGDSYLIARAKAIKAGSDTFTDSSKIYNTKTGKAI